ncbi:MAG: ATP-binding protein [Treponema sp.]|jgi:Mg-chelatase subunit ChlI|nr:ATP-binding protein [Treponema sp.]
MSHGSAGRDVFPFTAIVGQEDMKLALLLAVINPKIGGVLAFGEKGTAKSTAVRALAALLPEIHAVKGCPFRCEGGDAADLCPECAEKRRRGETLETEPLRMRVADLPVSATEDRLTGSLDLEKAISQGVRRFEPGILAMANRGILYVDEVNLLEDHLVDLILDSAAMGVNTVEREGVSYRHPARFILVGTMNPEEGELRPQLLDRFGLCVEIRGIQDADQRVEIIKRRAGFDQAPRSFIDRWHGAEQALAGKIAGARRLLPNVRLDDALLRKIVSLAIELEVDGHRADLTLMKAAAALAALDGRGEVIAGDVKRAAPMVFLHRMTSLPFERERPFNAELAAKILDA